MEVSSVKNNLKGLKFGIMCSVDKLQKWQAESVRLLTESGAECSLLIVDDNVTVERSFLQKIMAYLHKNAFYQLYLRFFFRPEAKREVDLKTIFSPFPKTIKCITVKKGFSEYFSDSDVEKIKSEELDFILRFGFNIIRGDILSAAKFGVWSFHHDDELFYRGGPPGFWEIVKDDVVTGSILQRLTDKLDGGVILKKGFFQTVKHSYQGQIDQLYFKTAKWPLYVCKDIVNGNAEYLSSGASITKAKIYKAPSNIQFLKFIFKISLNKIKFHYRELFTPEQWNIAVKDKKSNCIFWMPVPPNNVFYADSFGIETEKGVHVLFENYNYKTGKGIISEVAFSNGKFSAIKSVLEEEFHLSYPFVFECENIFYCIPETVNANEIRLYSYENKTGNLKFEKVLIENFPGIDSTLVYYKEKWWLFTTIKGDSNTDLYIFYSDALDGEYVPHKGNPVKIDVRNSRPGGKMFIKDNVLFRPAQNSSETYGQNVVLNKVTLLDENRFEEVVVEEIKPLTNSKFKKGLHTYCDTGNFIVFDGKQYRFNIYNFKRQLNRKLLKTKS